MLVRDWFRERDENASTSNIPASSNSRQPSKAALDARRHDAATPQRRRRQPRRIAVVAQHQHLPLRGGGLLQRGADRARGGQDALQARPRRVHGRRVPEQ
ncbi:hypothetical protein S40288_11691, partial [Stachybotrys chartarum IBT 40288]